MAILREFYKILLYLFAKMLYNIFNDKESIGFGIG